MDTAKVVHNKPSSFFFLFFLSYGDRTQLIDWLARRNLWKPLRIDLCAVPSIATATEASSFYYRVFCCYRVSIVRPAIDGSLVDRIGWNSNSSPLSRCFFIAVSALPSVYRVSFCSRRADDRWKDAIGSNKSPFTYRVLPRFLRLTKFYWVLASFSRFYRVLSVST